jgi:hypothetical protein
MAERTTLARRLRRFRVASRPRSERHMPYLLRARPRGEADPRSAVADRMRTDDHPSCHERTVRGRPHGVIGYWGAPGVPQRDVADRSRLPGTPPSLLDLTTRPALAAALPPTHAATARPAVTPPSGDGVHAGGRSSVLFWPQPLMASSRRQRSLSAWAVAGRSASSGAHASSADLSPGVHMFTFGRRSAPRRAGR